MKRWIIPPPTEPTKTPADFERERTARVNWLVRHGRLHSHRIKAALLKIPTEDFIPSEYRQYAYEEVPLPSPGEQATISCPHSYPLFYEPMGLDEGHRFLEEVIVNTQLGRELCPTAAPRINEQAVIERVRSRADV